MFSISHSRMEQVVIHKVGNKSREESVTLSHECIDITKDDETQDLLFQYLIQPFQRVKHQNCFVHSADLSLNEVYNYVTKVFEDDNSFLAQSQNIALHLYENSLHPRVKGGEFYMVYLSNVHYEDMAVDAIGLFRTENKDTYLKVVDQDHAFGVIRDEGANIDALDKGCLVLNVGAEEGYRVFVVDAHSKGANEEARYWRDNFLRIKPVPTEERMTRDYIEMVQSFVTEKAGQEDKIRPVELQSKAVKFFEDNDTFSTSRFEQEVLQNPDEVQAFREFQGEFMESHHVEAPDEFRISKPSVQAVKKRIKSVIKLDKLVNIYVRSLHPEDLKKIERGHDKAKNMHYYKIYFENEE